MKRTTIMLPRSLKSQVEAQARRHGLSLGGYIRQSLERSLKQENGANSRDPLFDDDFVVEDDGPKDLAENHDKYLEQMLSKEHQAQVAAWKRGKRR
jgi:hypothetical protein